MYVIIDDRSEVTGGYTATLSGEGIAAAGFRPIEFLEWFRSISERDVDAIQSFVLGEFDGCLNWPGFIRNRSSAPIIALSEIRSLERTLELFAAGADDVVRKPVHVKEIVARTNAVWRRVNRLPVHFADSRMRIHFDGRDIEIDGEPMPLPRRERRILEFLVKNAHRRVTKTQIFNAVYGIFEDEVDEVVVEGHISKLRRKLRLRLGRDVIDAKRYLGYQFLGDAIEVESEARDGDEAAQSSSESDTFVYLVPPRANEVATPAIGI